MVRRKSGNFAHEDGNELATPGLHFRDVRLYCERRNLQERDEAPDVLPDLGNGRHSGLRHSDSVRTVGRVYAVVLMPRKRRFKVLRTFRAEFESSTTSARSLVDSGESRFRQGGEVIRIYALHGPIPHSTNTRKTLPSPLRTTPTLRSINAHAQLR